MQEVKTLHIGDLHFDAIDIDNFETEFNDFLYPLIEEEQPNIVVLHGDIFDTRVSLDSRASKMAFTLMSTLCELSTIMDLKVIVIKGTLTHDYSQLDNFSNLEDTYENFKVVNRCSSESIEIEDGLTVDVLYIPEEYPKDYYNYYGEHFFNFDSEGEPESYKQYDMIIGHGEIDKFAGYVDLLESESFVHSTPLHEADEFLSMLEEANGYCTFGHIHVRLEYKKRILSTGSLTRWAHGEEKPKGVYLVTMSRESEDYQWSLDIQFKENPFAPIYKKYNADEIFDEDATIDTIYNTIIDLIDSEGLTKIRMDFSDYNLSPENFSILKGKFVGDRRVDIRSKAKIKPIKVSDVDDDETSVELQEESLYDNRFDYLKDAAIPYEERLKKYIDEEITTDMDISIDDIRSITAPIK